MAFPGQNYAPPGVYTKTNFDSPVQGLSALVRIPLLIGTGSEILTQSSLEIVRGSSSSVDQRIVQEDVTGRAVVSISSAGQVTLGDFNGDRSRIQVKKYPIVTGDGTGTTATNAASINVTVNGSPVVVLAVTGAMGVLQLSVSPLLTDTVLVTYYFKRTDTLILDTLSGQVSPAAPVIYGTVAQNYVITEDEDDTLLFTVDSEDEISVTISASPTAGWTAAQVAAFINSAASGTSLVASAVTNNFGELVLSLTADRDIEVGSGTANSVLGLTAGDSSSRNKVFYTFQGPIVDGSNGGVTSTDPADVTVKVDGTQVIPDSVDGASRAVTLPFAPEVGSVVTIQYHFNAWQDTFDYLAHRNVTAVTQAGLTSDRKDYTDGTDFVLKDDLILWGTAVTVESGEHTSGATRFTDTQVTATLVDTRQYMAACEAVVDSSVSPPRDSRKIFTLPLQATSGNGRDTPLGSTTYSAVTNGRIDLPTDRPDLVLVYWGFSVSDALERGVVTVTKVDSETNEITLAEAVPVGASVYATFYYNTLVDQEYTLTCVSAGASGVGTYSISNEEGDAVYTPRLGSKSAGLATITLQFPSGSERSPDFRFETPFDTTDFEGPVEEDVTVTFTTQAATLGKFTVPSAGPYYIVSGASDHFDVEFDGGSLTGGYVNLSDPMGSGSGFSAQLVGAEIAYEASSGGRTYEVDGTNNELNLEVDGVLIQAATNLGGTQDCSDYVEALNRASMGEFGVAVSGGASTILLAAGASDQTDYYVGWTVRVTAGAAAGDTRTVSAYNGSTRVATVSVAWTGAPGVGDTYHIFNPDALPILAGTTRFLSPVTIAAGAYDQLVLSYTGSSTGQTTISLTGGQVLTPGTYTSSSLLAAEVQTQVDAAIAAAGVDCVIVVDADTSGRITFALALDPTDTAGGFLEFVTGASEAVDFALLAGLDTAGSAQGSQAKLVNSSIARRYTDGAVGPLLYDRLVLRNRLVPGRGSQDGVTVLDQCELKVLGGSGVDLAGLTSQEYGYAGIRGTMLTPTLVGEVGLSGGQVPAGTYGDARDLQPVVTFYAAGGTTDQNNVFKFTFEGTPVTVEFTDAAGAAIADGGSADVPLGPVSSVFTVLGQIDSAMTAAGIATSPVWEGASIRLRGTLVTSAASIVIGTGSANDVLGFSSGDSATRTELKTEVLVSALMAHNMAWGGSTLTTGWSGGGAADYFAYLGLARTVKDEANAKYLYLQSLGISGAGTLSSISIDEAGSNSVTLPGTGLGIEEGDGGTGEDAVEGYYVTSSDSVNGSGTVNSSVLNSGTGQDGNVGQTYRDSVTGLTLTVLEATGGGSYPDGSYFVIRVRKNVVTDSNLTVNSIPGVQLTVSNTLGITVGDTAIVTTYEKGGSQPSVGDVYYVSYQYTKQDYAAALYTKMASIQAAYGANSTENPVTLASWCAIRNGAVVLAIKQVQKDSDSDADNVNDTASETAFLTALSDVEGALPGGTYPDILVPLKGDSLTLFQTLAQHCDLQSSIRYRAERSSIVGLSAGTQPRSAGDTAAAVKRSRVRMVYPDMYTLSLTNAEGSTDSFLVDGTYMAAAVAGNRCSPTIDVATPWTGSRILGFDDIARVLDAVEQNQVAVRGITIIDQQQRVIKIRQGLTTDMSNVLTKLPTVLTIADEVQRQARVALDRFIGTKFLAGVTGQIESQLSTTMKQLKAAQIIAAYTGIAANVAEDDPTVAEVEAYYQPVFPLLYIVIQFNLRSSL